MFRHLWGVFNCCRIARTCLGFSAALGPIHRPAFQGFFEVMTRSERRMIAFSDAATLSPSERLPVP